MGATAASAKGMHVLRSVVTGHGEVILGTGEVFKSGALWSVPFSGVPVSA